MTEKQRWTKGKQNIMKELVKLERLPWAENKEVAASVFPYVMVEAINILKNSEIITKPFDYAQSSEATESMLSEVGEKPTNNG